MTPYFLLHTNAHQSNSNECHWSTMSPADSKIAACHRFSESIQSC